MLQLKLNPNFNVYNFTNFHVYNVTNCHVYNVNVKKILLRPPVKEANKPEKELSSRLFSTYPMEASKRLINAVFDCCFSVMVRAKIFEGI